MKKFLKFFGIVLGVAVISFATSVWISQRNTSISNDSIIDRFDGTEEYHPTATGLRKLSLEEVGPFYAVPNKREVRYYVPRTGEVKSITLQGSTSSKTLITIRPRALAITWSPDGNELIAQYATDYTYADLTKGTSAPVGKHIEAPAFSKSSNEVAYLYYEKGAPSGTISIADSKFQSFKNILQTRLKNWEIQWNDKRKLSLIATAETNQLNALYVLDIDTKHLTQLINEQEDLEVSWAPDGTRLLYSRKSGKGTELFFMTMAAKTPVSLGLSIPSSKCAWGKDSIHAYCAVPDKTQEDAIVQLDTGPSKIIKKELLSPIDAGLIKAHDLVWVDSLQILLFKNFRDGRLYALTLEF